MKLIFVIMFICIAGCDDQNWNNSPQKYTCTDTQMSKVMTETKWCTENTDYMKNYCYGSAIMRSCTLINLPSKED